MFSEGSLNCGNLVLPSPTPCRCTLAAAPGSLCSLAPQLKALKENVKTLAALVSQRWPEEVEARHFGRGVWLSLYGVDMVRSLATV